jgi:hypothetical protein
VGALVDQECVARRGAMKSSFGTEKLQTMKYLEQTNDTKFTSFSTTKII